MGMATWSKLYVDRSRLYLQIVPRCGGVCMVEVLAQLKPTTSNNMPCGWLRCQRFTWVETYYLYGTCLGKITEVQYAPRLCSTKDQRSDLYFHHSPIRLEIIPRGRLRGSITYLGGIQLLPRTDNRTFTSITVNTSPWGRLRRSSLQISRILLLSSVNNQTFTFHLYQKCTHWLMLISHHSTSVDMQYMYGPEESNMYLGQNYYFYKLCLGGGYSGQTCPSFTRQYAWVPFTRPNHVLYTASETKLILWLQIDIFRHSS